MRIPVPEYPGVTEPCPGSTNDDCDWDDATCEAMTRILQQKAVIWNWWLAVVVMTWMVLVAVVAVVLGVSRGYPRQIQ